VQLVARRPGGGKAISGGKKHPLTTLILNVCVCRP